ncbi:MAG TPA: hypothetical protein ENN27_05100 [Candidatus Atribacteria bacterium]|nr:hypothetical protein [Candidatus Atribacteria bacterium]
MKVSMCLTVVLMLVGCQHTGERVTIGEEFKTFVLLLNENGEELKRQSIYSGLWSEAVYLDDEVDKIVLVMDLGRQLPFNWQIWLWQGIDHKVLLMEGYEAWQPIGVLVDSQKVLDYDAVEIIGWRGSRIDQAAWRFSRYIRFYEKERM